VVDFSTIEPLSLQTIKLCHNKACRVKGDRSASPVLAVGQPVGQVAAAGMTLTDGGFVPLHPDTVKLLEQFVAEHRYSVLRKSAMIGAMEVYQKLWQRDDEFRLLDRFVARGDLQSGTILSTQRQLAWLVYAAPINADTRALLESLSDDRHYYIGSRAAARLAVAWARFGDMDRADVLLARARRASPGKFDHVQLARADLNHGRISGRIVLPGGAEQVRLGLFRVSPDPTRKPEKLPGHPAAFSVTSTVRLTTSVVLGADGRFALDDLGSGDYYLALLVPSGQLAGADQVAGRNVPDLIRLSAAAPRRDLGTIRLTPR